MTQTAKIVVVGSVNTDMVVRAPHLPLPGETVLGGTFSCVPGGKGANQAVAAARLGAEVTLVACVGEDSYGDLALRSLAEEGIATEFIRRDPDFPTGVALIGVDATTGENAILVASGANHALNPADIDRAAQVIENADVLVCQMEVRLDVVIAALERAHRAGVTTVLNPAPALPLPEYAWSYVCVLTPNAQELEALGGDADALRRAGVGSVVVTCGAAGARLYTESGEEAIPAAPVPQVVDTTAAGDCFTGAFAVALGEEMPLKDAAQFACAAASLSVTQRGAQPSLPHRDALAKFLGPSTRPL
jgi:ribokinase